uniref:hypothetical protein n=1 Tax=Pseudomonas viridiflava TaxID=33069 RepID=UPI00197B3DB4
VMDVARCIVWAEYPSVELAKLPPCEIANKRRRQAFDCLDFSDGQRIVALGYSLSLRFRG